uniref:Uncharacterized protein n=1 Tax=Oryza sativa subsp. japonica TaxID=39947 RepID=Q7XEP3_ORYSJ|nr:hypothetical protein LOC_Os10g27320 [Oryza sativa Japonica Group]
MPLLLLPSTLSLALSLSLRRAWTSSGRWRRRVGNGRAVSGGRACGWRDGRRAAPRRVLEEAGRAEDELRVNGDEATKAVALLLLPSLEMMVRLCFCRWPPSIFCCALYFLSRSHDTGGDADEAEEDYEEELRASIRLYRRPPSPPSLAIDAKQEREGERREAGGMGLGRDWCEERDDMWA